MKSGFELTGRNIGPRAIVSVRRDSPNRRNGGPVILPVMPTQQAGRPRARSAFAAAFLSLIFPGLGQPTPVPPTRPRLCRRADPADRAARRHRAAHGQAAAGRDADPARDPVPDPDRQLLALGYRVIAAVDAWRVADYLNRIDGTEATRVGSVRLSLRPASAAGLLAVVLVMSGVHVAVAYYDVQAQGLLCIFDKTTDSCAASD